MSIRKGRLTSTGVLAAPVNFPTGSVLDFAGATAPDGWLLCFGQAVSRTEYAALFAALGETYGVGDGSTTFNLPDYRGRVLVGKDDMGGVAASRMTTAGAGINGASLGAAGGAQTHSITTAQVGAHSHSPGTLNITSSGTHDHAEGSGSTGGGDPDYRWYGTRNIGVTKFRPGGSSSTLTVAAETSSDSHTHASSSFAGATASNAASTPHQNTQPSIVANKIIKV